MLSPSSPLYRPRWGWLSVFLGLYPIAFALKIFPAGDTSSYAPMWMAFWSGLILVWGGTLMLVRRYAKINTLCMAGLLTALGTVSTWNTLFSPDEGFAGAFGGLTEDQNVVLARWAFGLAAIACFAMSGYAIQQFLLGSIHPGVRAKQRAQQETAERTNRAQGSTSPVSASKASDSRPPHSRASKKSGPRHRLGQRSPAFQQRKGTRGTKRVPFLESLIAPGRRQR